MRNILFFPPNIHLVPFQVLLQLLHVHLGAQLRLGRRRRAAVPAPRAKEQSRPDRRQEWNGIGRCQKACLSPPEHAERRPCVGRGVACWPRMGEEPAGALQKGPMRGPGSGRQQGGMSWCSGAVALTRRGGRSRPRARRTHSRRPAAGAAAAEGVAGAGAVSRALSLGGQAPKEAQAERASQPRKACHPAPAGPRRRRAHSARAQLLVRQQRGGPPIEGSARCRGERSPPLPAWPSRCPPGPPGCWS